MAVATLLAAFAAAPLCATPAVTATRTPHHPAAAPAALHEHVVTDAKGKKGTRPDKAQKADRTGKGTASSKAGAAKGAPKSGTRPHATRPVPVEDPPPFAVYQARNRHTGPAHDLHAWHESHPPQALTSQPAASRPAASLTVAERTPTPRNPAPRSAAATLAGASTPGHDAGPTHEAASIRDAAPRPAQPGPTATGPALTVNDFLRAAGNTAPSQASPSPATAAAPAFFASGQSHPDDDETLSRSHGVQLDASDADIAPTAPRNGAPVVAGNHAPRPSPPPPSVMLVSPQRSEAPAIRSRTDVLAPAPVVTAHVAAAPPPLSPAPAHTTIVASGFGPEVDVATDAPDARPAPGARKSKPAAPPVARNIPPPVSTMTVAERDYLTEAAIRPMVLPAVYSRNGRVMMPAPLKGSREVLVHQNTMADADGLERIENEAQLNQMRAAGVLMGFPESAALHVNDELPAGHRAARPWTVRFAVDTSHHFYERFHQPLIVTSAVRTIDYQLRLERINGNAAGIEGATASPHLTGQALDLAKGRMNAAQLAWMRAYLLPLMRAGLIDVEEEFQQSCFHISVYRRYAPPSRKAHTKLTAETRTPRQPAETADDEE